MILESIKQLLGEELASQVEYALKGKGKDGKDVDLVVGNDGSYVPEAKFNEQKTSLDATNKTIADIVNCVKQYGGSGDSKTVKDDILNAIKDVQDKSQKQIQALILENGLTNALKDAKAKNIKAVKALLDSEKIMLDKDNKIIGLDEQVKALINDDATSFLFEQEKAEPKNVGATVSSAVPNTSNNNQASELKTQIEQAMGLKN